MRDTTVTKMSPGGRRAYLSAHAKSSEIGETITYRRSSESSPSEWQKMQEETEKIFSPRSSWIDQEAELEEMRAEELAEDLEKRETEYSIRDSRGRRVESSREAEELRSYSISIGLGEMRLEELAEILAERSESGLSISPLFGVWERALESSARVQFSGEERGALELLEILAEILPSEETVLVEISRPEIRFEELDQYRQKSRRGLEEIAIESESKLEFNSEPRIRVSELRFDRDRDRELISPIESELSK